MAIDRDMTAERFAELLDAYGADIGRWPPQVQGRAQTLIAYDRLTARLVAEAQAFDRPCTCGGQRRISAP